MIYLRIQFILLCVLLVMGLSAREVPLRPAIDPAKVVVVANANSKDSLAVARYYVEARSIPEKNLIALRMTSAGAISWEEYRDQIRDPLLDALAEKELITWLDTDEKDAWGRRRARILTHDIEFLVLCQHVPWRINNKRDEVPPEELADLRQAIMAQSSLRGDALEEVLNRFRTTLAAVDSELALLPLHDTPLVGYLVNPWFRQKNPGLMVRSRFIRTARLDGFSREDIIQLIDSALAGERKGLLGRVYIDEDGRRGGYQMGNDMLSSAADLWRELGFPVSHDKSRETFSLADRFDAPAIYFGWWTEDVNGPFLLPDMRLPDGAIAFHVHSFSAQRMRNPGRHWTSPLVNRNAAATIGNVYEPYLQFTHRIDYFTDAILEGMSTGEAAWYALPVISWAPLFVGDPLYRPFAITLDDQIQKFQEGSNDPELVYAIIRRMNQYEAEGEQEQLKELGQNALKRFPGHPALALALSAFYQKTGDSETAAKVLESVLEADDWTAQEWALGLEIAQKLDASYNKGTSSLELYQKLLENPQLPLTILLSALKQARQTAMRWGEPALVKSWGDRLRELEDNQ